MYFRHGANPEFPTATEVLTESRNHTSKMVSAQEPQGQKSLVEKGEGGPNWLRAAKAKSHCPLARSVFARKLVTLAMQNVVTRSANLWRSAPTSRAPPRPPVYVARSSVVDAFATEFCSVRDCFTTKCCFLNSQR